MKLKNFVRFLPYIIYTQYCVNIIGLPLYYRTFLNKIISKSIYHK